MAWRLPFALLALLLAACSVKTGENSAGSGESGPASPSTAPATVSCSLGGATSFNDDCTLERSQSGGKQFIVLRHPDGGFRRLEELEAGKRYKALDGADEVEVEANGADLELTLGDDHYLFPAAAPSPNQSNAPQR